MSLIAFPFGARPRRRARHRIERRVLSFVQSGLREVDGIACVGLGDIGVGGRGASVELVRLLVDACLHLRDMGLPLVADVLPMRRRLVARTIGVVLELIGSCSCPITCAGGVGSKLILGVLTGRTELLRGCFRLVGYFLELCAQIGVCHQKLLHHVKAGSSPTVLTLRPPHSRLM
ncbi:MAG: hypothetical protein ACLQLO_10815 [Mycobacterium sp.]